MRLGAVFEDSGGYPTEELRTEVNRLPTWTACLGIWGVWGLRKKTLPLANKTVVGNLVVQICASMSNHT
eukprot:635027-Amphidinium_carterae.1